MRIRCCGESRICPSQPSPERVQRRAVSPQALNRLATRYAISRQRMSCAIIGLQLYLRGQVKLAASEQEVVARLAEESSARSRVQIDEIMVTLVMPEIRAAKVNSKSSFQYDHGNSERRL